MFAAWAYELTPEGVKRERDIDRSQSITRQTGKRLNAQQRRQPRTYCQSDANCSPLGVASPTPLVLQAMRLCHSANAAERRVL